MLNVDKGAAWLDEFMPGWYNQVNMDVLDMGTCKKDVLSQLGLGGVTSFTWECKYGHNWPIDDLSNGESDTIYAALTVLWKGEIRERRKKDKV